MNFTEARSKLAAVLAPVEDTDPDVIESLVDAIEPPALMLGWADPMLEPTSVRNDFTTGHLVVTAVAARMAPGEGIAKLEELVNYTIRRIRGDTEQWQLTDVTGPRVFIIAQTNYIAARIAINVTVEQ